nr:CorA family divalent cation transporter [Eubacterium sp. MSJ-13]
MESHRDFLYGTFQVPAKEYEKTDEPFAIYIMKNRVIILSDDDAIDKKIIRISGRTIAKDYSLERFIYDFFVSFIEDDLLFLQKIEHKITEIEEQVMIEQSDKFNIKLLRLKRIIARFYHYYTQLAETGDELAGNEEEFFTADTVELFKMYSEKMTRLAQETQILREYAMQVQDVYQSEIEIHQNDVMKMLTIVTTIFLPLTLIAGWYGMNFSYMPELKMKYAYPVVIGISALIVVVSLVVFKKKNYW